MNKFPIGVLTESFKTDMKTALEKAQKIGLSGVQIYATQGDMAPQNMSAQKRKDFLSMVKSYGLTISALCGDLGHGFGDPAINPALIERSKRILDLAKDLGTNVVTTHIGVVPSDPKHPRYQIMQEACGELAEYADKAHAHFAIETGPELAITLKHFLDSLHSTGVAVNLDPANFVMVTGDDPVGAVHTLREYIVHTHAKDGKKLLDVDPEKLYHQSESEMLGDPAFIELPLGKGSVDFPAYLQALDDIGYRGFLTIEREVGDDPDGDIILAKDFLNAIMNK